jgi:small subunit ribosomal protein S12
VPRLQPKHRPPRTRVMRGHPQLRGTISKVYSTNPRKPNSANRKVAKVSVGGARSVISAIKGIPNSLKRYSRVWVSGVGFRDTPGVNTKLVVGKEGFSPQLSRLRRRSVYAVKKSSM